MRFVVPGFWEWRQSLDSVSHCICTIYAWSGLVSSSNDCSAHGKVLHNPFGRRFIKILLWYSTQKSNALFIHRHGSWRGILLGRLPHLWILLSHANSSIWPILVALLTRPYNSFSEISITDRRPLSTNFQHRASWILWSTMLLFKSAKRWGTLRHPQLPNPGSIGPMMCNIVRQKYCISGKSRFQNIGRIRYPTWEDDRFEDVAISTFHAFLWNEMQSKFQYRDSNGRLCGGVVEHSIFRSPSMQYLARTPLHQRKELLTSVLVERPTMARITELPGPNVSTF